MIGSALVLLGALLTLLAAVGVLRFPDVLTRMHALTKASTLGFVLVAVGATTGLSGANDVTSALLAAGLQLLTLPVAATLIARSAHLADRARAGDRPRRPGGRLSRPQVSRAAAGTRGTGPPAGAR